MLTTAMLVWTLWQGDMIVARYETFEQCLAESYKAALTQGVESECKGPYSLNAALEVK